MTEHPDDESVLRDWLHVLSRQKLIVIAALTVVPLLAFIASHRQQHLYQASATVLVSEQDPTAQALNISSSTMSPPDRYAATQAKLARVATVAEMAVKAAHVPGRTAAGLLATSSVSADPSADLLTFSVTDPSPAVAMKLANSYAAQFASYRRGLNVSALSAAIADARRKLRALRAAPGALLLSRRLAATAGNLEELQALQAVGPSAAMVGSAGSATLAQPKTRRNIILGVLVGLALGVALAFLRETLDTRARSAEELRTRLGMPLLGQVPRHDGRGAESAPLPALRGWADPSTEPLRILKNNFETARLGKHFGSVVVTSPSGDEGKSTTAASLAVTLARAGRHVILVDLDLRRPSADLLFDLNGRPGLESIAAGTEPADALIRIDLAGGRRRAQYSGMLEVLTAGPPPYDPGEFLASGTVLDTLAALKDRCDVLLIVTPPLLAFGDAMTVAPHADAVVLVAGVNHVRRETLAETRRVLEGCPTSTLGVIATDGAARIRGPWLGRLRPAFNWVGRRYGWTRRALAPSVKHAIAGATHLAATVSASVGASSDRLLAKKRREKVPDA